MDQQAIVTLVLAGLAGIVWLVRLEGRVNHVEKLNSARYDELKERVSAQEVRHEALDSRLLDEVSKLRESTARIEGYLKAKQEE